MANISNFLKPTTRKLLDEGEIVSEHRPYLGMSQLGHSCSRYLWYSFRWACRDTFPRRVQRLFNRGHREEAVIVADLARIGITVTGDQDEVVCAWGHCKGHRDGVAENVPEAPKTPHLTEFKTMSDKYFKDICKRGLKVSKPVYYGQVQLYMKFFKLTRALFIAVNKNDDSYYVERIRYDAAFAKLLVSKAEAIILSPHPPRKTFAPTWYECKYCNAFDICHKDGQMCMNCRTCVNCEPAPTGKWLCTIDPGTDPDYDGRILSTAQQREGCERYILLKEV